MLPDLSPFSSLLRFCNKNLKTQICVNVGKVAFKFLISRGVKKCVVKMSAGVVCVVNL